MCMEHDEVSSSAHKLICGQLKKNNSIKQQKSSTLMILSSLNAMLSLPKPFQPIILYISLHSSHSHRSHFHFWLKSKLTLNGRYEYVWCILISLQVNYAQMLPFFFLLIPAQNSIRALAKEREKKYEWKF